MRDGVEVGEVDVAGEQEGKLLGLRCREQGVEFLHRERCRDLRHPRRADGVKGGKTRRCRVLSAEVRDERRGWAAVVGGDGGDAPLSREDGRGRRR